MSLRLCVLQHLAQTSRNKGYFAAEIRRDLEVLPLAVTSVLLALQRQKYARAVSKGNHPLVITKWYITPLGRETLAKELQ